MPELTHPAQASSRTRLAGVLLTAALAAGCSSLNTSIDPGSQPLQAFEEALGSEDQLAEQPQDSDSLTNGHDRRHWGTLTVQVPVRQVESRPFLDWSVHLVHELPRQRGEFPTDLTALDLPKDSGDYWLEAGANAVTGVGSTVGSVVPLVGGELGDVVVANPEVDFQRLPQYPEPDLATWFGGFEAQPSMADEVVP